MSTSGAIVADAVLAELNRDLDTLSQQLHHFEIEMKSATAGTKDSFAMNAIALQVRKLETSLDQRRDLFRLLFSGDWSSNPGVKERIKEFEALLKKIAGTLTSVLKMGQPDPGKGLVSRSVEKAQKQEKAIDKMFTSSTVAKQPIITMPDLPASVASNPLLAVAIVLDVVFRLVLARRKK